MSRVDIGYNRYIRLSDLSQLSNLAGMVAAELRDYNFILWAGTEQRQRKPDIIIEIFRCRRHTKMLTQDVIRNLPCHRFADRAGYRHNLEIHPAAILCSKVAESFYSITYLQQTIVARINIPADHGTHRTFGKGLSYVIISVKIFSRDSKETIAGPGSA